MLSQLFCVLACLDKVIGSFRRSPRGGPSAFSLSPKSLDCGLYCSPEIDGAIRLKVPELVKAVARLGTPDTQRNPGGTPITACVTVGGQSASSPRASPTPA